MMKRSVYITGFILLIIFPVLSLIGTHFPLWQSVKLFGQSSYDRPEFNFESMSSGEFQGELNSWHGDHFFLREDAIRVGSQLNYTFYNTSISKEVFIGKEGHLFHTSGLKEYKENSRWMREVDSRINTLENFSNYLEKRGKYLFVIIPPDKIRARSEYLPDDVDIDSLKNAYFHYQKVIQKTSLHVIDLSDYLRNEANIPSQSLFPKYGFHWNIWPAFEGYNRVLEEVEKVTRDTLSKIAFTNFTLDDNPKFQDIDLWRSLNIYSGIQPEPIEIPEYHFNGKPNSKKVLVSGDSFFLTWRNAGLLDSTFAGHEYWYYSEYIFKGKDDTNKVYTKNLDFEKHIEPFDIIWLIAHEPNLNAFPFGFEHLIEDNIQYE